jgi:hypothetical protein
MIVGAPRSLAPPHMGPTADILQLSGGPFQTSGNTSQGGTLSMMFFNTFFWGPCTAKDLVGILQTGYP